MRQPILRVGAGPGAAPQTSRLYTIRQSMGPRDRDDLISLVARIQAIEETDRAKAGIARELREKLQRCLTSGWLPEPTAMGAGAPLRAASAPSVSSVS
jgi:hypothetical protein